jgi:RND family efflux transporter MFP subunit
LIKALATRTLNNQPGSRAHSWLWRGGLALLLTLALAVAAQPIPTVEVVSIVRQPVVETVTLAGSLRSPQNSALSARVAGYVTQIVVQAGDRVQKGQLLVTLDEDLAKLELRRREALLREAEAQVADQERRVSEAADLIAANNFSRSELASLRAELAAGRARRDQFRSETDIQRIRLGHHRVLAPFAGVITAKMAEVGRQVAADTTLLELARMEPIWAEARLPERYLNQVSIGKPVRIMPGYEGGRWLNSKVTSRVPVSNDLSRTFLVRSELANPDWQLAPGMSLRMAFTLGDDRPTLQVPADAITLSAAGEQQIWLVKRSDAGDFIAEPRAIELGRRGATRVEISGDGFDAGDRVITRGNESLVPGQSVAIQASSQDAG